MLANTPPPRTFQGDCQAGRARIIIGIRDPRAVFLSTLDFLDWRVPLPSPDWHPVAFLRSSLRHIYSSRLDLARGLLRGDALPDNPYDIEAQFSRIRILYHNPKVLTLRYEEIHEVATSDECNTAARIAEYLGITETSNTSKQITGALAKASATKHRALVNRWQDELPPEIKEEVAFRFASLIGEFGYE